MHLHNTIAEYLSVRAPTAGNVAMLERFSQTLIANTQFDPGRALAVMPVPAAARAHRLRGGWSMACPWR